MKLTLMFICLLLCFGCNQDPEIPQHESKILRVYPNPADLEVRISISNPGSKAFTLAVFGTRGEVLFEENDSVADGEYHVDLSDEPKGVYDVALKIDGQTLTRKVFKR